MSLKVTKNLISVSLQNALTITEQSTLNKQINFPQVLKTPS